MIQIIIYYAIISDSSPESATDKQSMQQKKTHFESDSLKRQYDSNHIKNNNETTTPTAQFKSSVVQVGVPSLNLNKVEFVGVANTAGSSAAGHVSLVRPAEVLENYATIADYRCDENYS